MEKLPSIIPSVWSVVQRDTAVLSPYPLVHVAGGKLGNIEAFARPLQDAGKRVWVHIDMISGLKMDAEGLAVVDALLRPTAIVTSNLGLAATARKMNKKIVLRVFVHDTQSLESSLVAIRRICPNVVCCMPAVVFPSVSKEFGGLGIPIVAAGLIRTVILRDSLLSHGISVEIGDERLW